MSKNAIVPFGKQQSAIALPENLKAIEEQGYQLEEIVGIAPTWEPKTIGDTIIGTVSDCRIGVGQYESTVVNLDTAEGVFAVWLSSDLNVKLGNVPEKIIGQNLAIRFEGMMRKQDGKWSILSPSSKKQKNDMKTFRVFRANLKR